MGIFREWRKTVAVRGNESLPSWRDQRLWLGQAVHTSAVLVLSESLGKMHERFFKLAAEDGRDAQRAQIVDVHRRVQAVTTQMGTGIQSAQRRDELRRQSRCRVHGQVDCNERSRANCSFMKRLPCQIEQRDLVAAPAEPGSGRGQPKRLAPQLIRR